MSDPQANADWEDARAAWCAENGRKGGSAKSPAKTRAARRNARKGGWPKGRPRKPTAERKKVVAVAAKRSCPKRKKSNDPSSATESA
jgi:hypothetical protein